MRLPLDETPRALEESTGTQEALGKVALGKKFEGSRSREADLVQCGQGIGPIGRPVSRNAVLVVEANVVV
jgi:hypothetical protein